MARPPDARRTRQLTVKGVRDALRSVLEVGSTFDAITLEAAGTCLEGESLPQVRDDNALLLVFDNGQVFRATVEEQK